MKLAEIEAVLRRLNDDSQRSGHATPFKVDCYELVELADALKAERERIEAIRNEIKVASLLSKPAMQNQELLKIWAQRLP